MITKSKKKKKTQTVVTFNVIIEGFEKPPGDCEEFITGISKGCFVYTILVDKKVVGKFCLK